MEQKKALLIKILTKLNPYRNLAEGILALLQSSYIDDKAIDGVITIISQSIKSVKKDNEKTVLQKWLEKIQQIRHMEEDENLSEEELDKLLFDI